MAGFLIAIVACMLPFLLGTFGLGRPRVVIGVGGVLALGWIVSLAAKPPTETNAVPLWVVAGMVALLYAIWCGGFWLGRRVRRIRNATPG
jgi:hypothetical protein